MSSCFAFSLSLRLVFATRRHKGKACQFIKIHIGVFVSKFCSQFPCSCCCSRVERVELLPCKRLSVFPRVGRGWNCVRRFAKYAFQLRHSKDRLGSHILHFVCWKLHLLEIVVPFHPELKRSPRQRPWLFIKAGHVHMSLQECTFTIKDRLGTH